MSTAILIFSISSNYVRLRAKPRCHLHLRCQRNGPAKCGTWGLPGDSGEGYESTQGQCMGMGSARVYHLCTTGVQGETGRDKEREGERCAQCAALCLKSWVHVIHNLRAISAGMQNVVNFVFMDDDEDEAEDLSIPALFCKSKLDIVWLFLDRWIVAKVCTCFCVSRVRIDLSLSLFLPFTLSLCLSFFDPKGGVEVSTLSCRISPSKRSSASIWRKWLRPVPLSCAQHNWSLVRPYGVGPRSALETAVKRHPKWQISPSLNGYNKS